MGRTRNHRRRRRAATALVVTLFVGVAPGVLPDTPTPSAEAAYPGDVGPLAFTKIARNPADPLGSISQRIGVFFPDGGQDDILAPNVCSGSLQELSDPAVSPDGRSVAFTCVGPFNTQIWTYTFDYSITFGARYAQVTSDSHPIRSASQPTWTPDGSRIVYTATNLATNDIQLFSSPRDGSVPPTPFAGPNVIGGEPTFAPAGDQVLLWNDVSDAIQLYEPATGTVRTVFRNAQPGDDSLEPGQIFAGQSLRDTQSNGNPFVNSLEPNWAPDSRSFTFNCGFLGADLEENNGQVCQIGSDGTGLRLVTQFDGIWTYGGASFSSTGAQILVSAFNATSGQSPRIYVFPATGQTSAPGIQVVPAEQATDTHFQPDAGPAVGTQPAAAGSIGPTPVPSGTGGDTGGGGGTSSSEIVSIDPARFVDSRPGQTTIDGTSQAFGPINAGQEITVQITGRNGIPDNATAAVLNITAIKPTNAGFFTIYPCGTQRPTASSLNYQPGNIIGNEIITKLSPTGTTCIYTQATTNITADITGYIPTGSTYTPVDPARFVDSRPGQTTIDGTSQAFGPINAGQEITVQITGRNGIPDNATAAVLNITAIKPTNAGFFTIYPCGTQRPTASSLNYQPGNIIGNEIITKLSPTGTTCIYTQATTNITADITGYIPTGSTYTPVDPARFVDSRPGQTTIDGTSQAFGPINAGQEITVQITGRNGIPDNATAAVLNITAIKPTNAGFFTIYPCGTQRPTASSLNYQPGNIIGNEIITKLFPTGTTCIYTQATTNITADITGYIPTG